MTTDTQKRFEAWAKTQGLVDGDFTKHNDGYAHDVLDCTWIGYQAGRADALAELDWQPIEMDDLLVPIAAYLFRRDGGCDGGLTPFDTQRGGDAEFNGKQMWEHKRSEAEPIAKAIYRWLKNHGKLPAIKEKLDDK